MTHQDRDRLAFSLALALLIHAVIIVMLTLVDWEIREYPVTPPVLVELLDYRSTPPAIEPTPPEEIPPEPEEQQPPEEPPAQEPPIDNRLADVTRDTEPEPPETALNVAEDRPAAAAAVNFVNEPLVGVPTDTIVDRDSDRVTDEELFGNYEEPEAEPIPDVFADGPLPPVGGEAADDQEIPAEDQESPPGFQRNLDLLDQSQASSGTTRDQTQRSTDDETASTEISLPDNIELEWDDEGSRRPIGLAPPVLVADDFDGLVPARVICIFEFNVNAEGQVMPASLIWHRPSGYTGVDQKVHTAVSGWHFEPAQGSRPVTVTCTLIVERDD